MALIFFKSLPGARSAVMQIIQSDQMAVAHPMARATEPVLDTHSVEGRKI